MKTIIHPGTIQTLRVHSIEGKFVLLGDENKQVPLPKIQFPGMAEEGAEVSVFTYFDNTRNLVASTQLPTLQVGQVGSFKVKNLNNLGAFIDIGSERDILIPFPEQKEELEEGRWVLVTLQYDDLGQRIFASTKINTYFKNYDIPYERGDEVDLIIADKLELGRRVIIDGKFVGFLFKQEMLRTYGEGDKVKGYIRKVEGREITVSTQKEGQELIDEAAERILEVLKSNKGYLRLHDDSDPEDIKRYLTMSKKTFKKAAGQLYKDQLITLTDRGIRLGGSLDVQEGDGEIKPLRKRITQVVAERNTVGGSPKRNVRDFQDGEMDRPRKSRYSNEEEGHDEQPMEKRSYRSEREERSPRSYERRDGDRRSSNREGGERSPRSYERRDGERRSSNGERGERSPRSYERRVGERRSSNGERAERSPRSYERRDGERRSNNSERKNDGFRRSGKSSSGEDAKPKKKGKTPDRTMRKNPGKGKPKKQ